MTRLNRRTVLAAAALCAIATTAAAQDAYPSKPITILVGFAPGGGTDLIARQIAPRNSLSVSARNMARGRAR